MTSEQSDRIDEKLDRIAEGLENLAGKKKKDDLDDVADEDSEIVNNNKEFSVVDIGNGKFTVTRNGVSIEMEIQSTGMDTAGYEKFQAEIARPADMVKIGQWIGKDAATQAVASKFAMFLWHLANRSENRGKDPKTWLTLLDFGLKPKVKSTKLKNPQTNKPLTAKQKVRYETALDFGKSDEQALEYACQ